MKTNRKEQLCNIFSNANNLKDPFENVDMDVILSFLREMKLSIL